jgi:hypothetical protein
LAATPASASKRLAVFPGAFKSFMSQSRQSS